MDLPQNIKNGTLYNMDCTFLSGIRYIRESADTISLIFSAPPSGRFPESFFLMPDGKEYDYRTFIFTLTEAIHPCQPQDSESFFTARAVTNDIPEQRKNFRVYVTTQVPVLFEGEKHETSVTVKDIGTGGFLFVSKKKYEPGTVLSAIFAKARTPVCITAQIQKLRPVRKEGLYGYGCQFTNLSPSAESMVRNFVFQTETLHAKAVKEREEALSR